MTPAPINPAAPGAPITAHTPPVSEILATTPGFDHGDGFKMQVTNDSLEVIVRMDGNEAEIGIGLSELLEAIGRYNHQVGS